jgi:SnoaL-like protein
MARSKKKARKSAAKSSARKAPSRAGASGSVQQQLAALARKVRNLEDIHAVRTLHFKYGYYIDMCLYDEACALFADDGEVRFLNGVYQGKAGVRRLYCEWFRNLFTKGKNGPVRGFLLDHLQLQDIVDVAPDGKTARGRFRALMLAGQHSSKEERVPNFPDQCWEGGIYENEYVNENGLWKIKRQIYNMLWQADYEPGWAKSGVHLPPIDETFPENPIGPDEILPITPKVWPETRVVPFHYAHPVTGKVWK